MLKLPHVGIDSSSGNDAPPVPMSYTKYVTKQMSKIEMVLKLIGTPDTMLVERFRCVLLCTVLQLIALLLLLLCCSVVSVLWHHAVHCVLRTATHAHNLSQVIPYVLREQ
jgi:hypothetical protein